MHSSKTSAGDAAGVCAVSTCVEIKFYDAFTDTPVDFHSGVDHIEQKWRVHPKSIPDPQRQPPEPVPR